MSRSETNKQRTWHWSPCLFLYDAGACTKEEHDPAKAVLYYRPRNVSVDTRTAFSGQLAGVAHFCRSIFTSPTYVKTKCGHVSLKHYGRFILMVCGNSRKWSHSTLVTVSRLIDSSTGGIPSLWVENPDKVQFIQKLNSLMDAIVFHALPDVNFEDGIYKTSSTSSSLSSPCYSASSEVLDDASPELSFKVALWRRMKSHETEETITRPQPKTQSKVNEQIDEETVLANLHRKLSVAPFLPLPKSGASSFLRAQQLLQTCQQHPGVLAGCISFKNRVLNSQLDLEMQLIISTIIDVDSEENGILQETQLSYQLPKDVVLYNLHVPQRALKDFYKYIPKISLKRRERKSLHSVVQQRELSSLRSALHNHSLQSYPASIPPLINKTKAPEASSSDMFSQMGPMNPLLLCSKISKNTDLMQDGRPSRSLPGSPRKIRVSTMLPDVGSDSPELRYKVLTARRQKPVTSTNNTPRRIPGMRNITKGNDLQANGFLSKGNNLTAPSLKRKEFIQKTDHKIMNGILDSSSQMDKENINSICQNQFTDRPNNELNIKNAKNKLNLNFAPEKVNRPREDYDEEEKISREINGSIFENIMSKDICHKSLKSQLIDMNIDEDESRSEESEISILELNSYAETKENGNRLFEEATKMDSPGMEFDEDDDDLENFPEAGAIHPTSVLNVTNTPQCQWTKETLYVQKSSNMALQLILENSTAIDPMVVWNLYRLATLALPEIEKSLLKTLAIDVQKEGDIFLQNSTSAVSTLDPSSLHSHSVETAHSNFEKYPQLTEITLRGEGDVVLWSHRSHKTETFYQSTGSCRPGLPIPSDTMARISHRARKRLERDHSITLL